MSDNPPKYYFDNINFNANHFNEDSTNDVALKRVMSVFENLTQIGLISSNTTNLIINKPVETSTTDDASG
jgi:hypothetical protein